MVKLVLYGFEGSPPVRPVLLALNALGLDYEFREVNTIAGEQNSEEFRKKNPQHTIPVLDDEGHFLWDSHAIMAFLVRKYAKNDDLYPKDFYQRAIVDQRLHFDTGVVFPNLRNTNAFIFANSGSKIPQRNIDAFHDALTFLETFLEDDYVAGKTLTIADFSLISTITSMEIYVQLDEIKYPKIVAWIRRMTQLPYYEKANGKGLAKFKEIIASKLTAS